MKTELEKLKEQRNQIERRIRKIEDLQNKCEHEWDEVKYEPEKKEICRDEFVYLGSDSYYKSVGTGTYTDVDRWSRVCKKCGKKEYTYQQEEVSVKTIIRPKF